MPGFEVNTGSTPEQIANEAEALAEGIKRDAEEQRARLREEVLSEEEPLALNQKQKKEGIGTLYYSEVSEISEEYKMSDADIFTTANSLQEYEVPHTNLTVRGNVYAHNDLGFFAVLYIDNNTFRDPTLRLVDQRSPRHEDINSQKREQILWGREQELEEAARYLVHTQWGTNSITGGLTSRPAPAALEFAEMIDVKNHARVGITKVVVRIPSPKGMEIELRRDYPNFPSSREMKNHTLIAGNGAPTQAELEAIFNSAKGAEIKMKITNDYGLIGTHSFGRFLELFNAEYGPFLTQEMLIDALSNDSAQYFERLPYVGRSVARTDAVRWLDQTSAAQKIIEQDAENMTPGAIWTEEKYRNHIADVVAAAMGDENIAILVSSPDGKRTIPYAVSRREKLRNRFDLVQRVQMGQRIDDDGNIVPAREIEYDVRMFLFQARMRDLLEIYLRDPQKIFKDPGWEITLIKEIQKIVVRTNAEEDAEVLKNAGEWAKGKRDDTVNYLKGLSSDAWIAIKTQGGPAATAAVNSLIRIIKAF